MATILFTDADGAWKLHNGKPWPASRLANWTPDSTPFGDSAARQSDGALTMLRLRDDFVVSFEVPLIPSQRSSNLVVQSENFGTTWALNGTPTRTPAEHVRTGITLDLLGDDSAVAQEYYHQTIGFTNDGVKAISAFVRVGPTPAATGAGILIDDATAGVTRTQANIIFDIVDEVPVVTMSGIGGGGTFLGYEYVGDFVYRLLIQTSPIVAANTNRIIVAPAAVAAEQGNIRIGGVQAENATRPSPYLYNTTAAREGVSLLEIADRLKYHLLNGGTCSVSPNGAAALAYPTCGLKPGTVPQLTLSDRRTMEYALSLQLINLAASPVRMLAHYAEQ